MRRGALVAAALLAVAPPGAGAADEDGEQPGEYARSGAFLMLTGVDAIGVFGESFTNSLGFHAHGGYRFHPRFALGSSFEWLASFDSVRGENDTGWTLVGDARAYLLTGRTQPYLLVGAGGTRLAGDGDFSARFGGGLDVYGSACESGAVCYAVSLGASYVLPTGSVADFDYVSLGWGFQARF